MSHAEANEKSWKTSPTDNARILEWFLQQCIVKLFKKTNQRGVVTHAHCIIVYAPKGGDSHAFSTNKFHFANLV